MLIDRGAGDRVRVMLEEALVIAREIGSTRAGQNVVELAAGLAVLREEWACAARFFGAVQAQIERMGLRRTPADDPFLARRIAKAREAMGSEAFAETEAAGRTLSYEGALDEVGAWLTAC